MLENLTDLLTAGTVAVYLSVGNIGAPIYTYKYDGNSISIDKIADNTTKKFINEVAGNEIANNSFPLGFFSKKRRHAKKNHNTFPMQLSDDVLNGKKHIHLDVK